MFLKSGITGIFNSLICILIIDFTMRLSFLKSRFEVVFYGSIGVAFLFSMFTLIFVREMAYIKMGKFYLLSFIIFIFCFFPAIYITRYPIEILIGRSLPILPGVNEFSSGILLIVIYTTYGLGSLAGDVTIIIGKFIFTKRRRSGI